MEMQREETQWSNNALEGLGIGNQQLPEGDQVFNLKRWSQSGFSKRETALFLLGEFRATSPILFRILMNSGADPVRMLQAILKEMDEVSGSGWPTLKFG